MDHSGGASGRSSDNNSSNRSTFGAATTSRSTSNGAGANTSVRGGISRLGIWLSLLFAMLMLLPIAIWAVVRAVRKNEASQNDAVVYQNLADARQIYGKIIKKY